jgi:hypothetical protein
MDTVEIHDVFVEAETAKAILCVIENEEFWVPKSQIHDNSEVYEKGQDGTLIVTSWWAEKEGLA